MVIGLTCGKTSFWKGQCYEMVFANCHRIQAKLNIQQRHSDERRRGGVPTVYCQAGEKLGLKPSLHCLSQLCVTLTDGVYSA